MPGLSFIYNSREDLRANKQVKAALDSIVHFDHYRKSVLSEEKSFVLASTAYDEYPIASFEDAGFFIYFEGQIYGKDVV